jgi:Holliday junction resolvase RusA-like endonuclease
VVQPALRGTTPGSDGAVLTRITLTIHGKPFAKQRARFGGGRTYTPDATVRFEAHVADTARPHFPEPLTGPVRVCIWATFKPAASWSQAKTKEHLHRPHTQKPDLDNIQKAILDGLNRIAFADDSQVAEIECRKMWGVDEKTVVEISRIGA